MPTNDHKLSVFLCHSSQDKPVVRELRQRLMVAGWIDPWLDEEKLLPGQDWDAEIEAAVDAADAVIVFLSKNSVAKEGYVQKEIRRILNKAEEKTENTIFIIPLRVDDCAMPKSLRKYHYQDYFPSSKVEWAYERLVGSLQIRADRLKTMTMGPQEYPGKEEIVEVGTGMQEHHPVNESDKDIPAESKETKERKENNLLLEVERKASLKEKRLIRKRGQGKTDQAGGDRQNGKSEGGESIQLIEATESALHVDEASQGNLEVFQWDSDTTGFPMIYVDPCGLWMQVLPVTRYQFSIFARDVNLPKLPTRRKDHLEDYFATGLSYKEARAYARWCGSNYELSDVQTWKQAYEWLKTKPVQARPGNWQELSKPAWQLWNMILQVNSPISLLDQTLMKEGVLEWVDDLNSVPNREGGMGKPFRNLWQVLRAPTDSPVHPRSDLSAFGLRLFRRK